MPAGFIPTRFIASEMEATIQAYFGQIPDAIVKLTERGEPAGYVITIPDGRGEPYRYRITITEETRRPEATKRSDGTWRCVCNRQLFKAITLARTSRGVAWYCELNNACAAEFDKDGYQL